MRRIRNHTLVVANQHIRMMIFAVRNPCHRIDERHRLIIILEPIGLGDLLGLQLPAIELLQIISNRSGGQWRHTALARFALFG